MKRTFSLFALLGVLCGHCFAADAELARVAGQLRAKDVNARAAAAMSLIERGAEAREVFPALIQALTEDPALDRLVAARALYARPRPAADTPALLGGLTEDTKGRVAAAWELSRIGPAAGGDSTRALIAALNHPDKHARNVIAVALATTGPQTSDAVPALLAVLREAGSADSPQANYKYPRASAAIALGMIGPEAREAVPALVEILAENGGWEFQRAANCFALGRIGPAVAGVLPALKQASQDASPIVRAQAAQAIQAITSTTTASRDVVTLVRALAAGSPRVSPMFIEGMRALGEFAGAIRPAAKTGSRKVAPPVHESIALALGYLDSLPQPPASGEIARQEKAGTLSDSARLYVMALGGVQAGITPALLESLAQGEQDARVLAARRLSALGPAAKEAVPALRANLGDADWLVRREAFLALCQIESSAAAPAAPSPASHIYQTFGERKLQLAMHYPPGWKAGDQRTAILFFSGSHKVQPDKDGKLPPLVAERAKLGLPVVNRGPGENHAPFCDELAKRGFVCARVEYRTRGKDGVLPGEDIADAVSAIRWVRGHAATLGIDPKRVVAAGGSSGGYLAASLFAFEDRYSTSGDGNISARPDAILLYSPLVDWLEAGIMSDSFLVVLNGDKELGAKVSPARHWRKDCPPTLVMVGTEEPPFTTVKEFAEKWKAVGAPMELFVADGGKHGFFAQPAWLERTLARTDEFLKTRGFSDASPAAKQAEAKPAPSPASFIYKTFGERKLQLVMHYPPDWKATDKRPAMLCFEGGANNPNDKSGQPYPLAAERAKLGLPVVNNGPSQAFAVTAEHFAQRGLVCIRVEYRKRKDDGSMPDDSIADAASAVRWVRAHAGELGVDAARIVACGASGGGHVSASIAALKEFDAPYDNLKISRRPDALILHSPLLDFLEGGTRNTTFLSAVNNDRALGERVSPARHWSKDQPPTLLFTGEKEPVFEMLCDFAKKWKAAGQRIELVTVAGGHVSSLNEKFIGDTLPRMEAFLKSIGFL